MMFDVWFWRYIFSLAWWLSWLERRPVTAEVVGSSPIRVAQMFERLKSLTKSSEYSIIYVYCLWDLSSAGRASALQAEGHRFEPYRSHLHNMPMWLNWQSSWFVISRLSVRVRSSAFAVPKTASEGEFPSGQRGQTVNLLAPPSVVRIHLPPFVLHQRRYPASDEFIY